MTYESKYLIDLGDILGVQIVCHHCKSKIILTQESEKGMIATCPLCNRDWMEDTTEEYQSLKQLVKLVRTASSILKGRKFSLKLEIAPPPTQS